MKMNLKTRIWRKLLRSLQRNSNTRWVNRVQDIANAVSRSTYNSNYHIDINGESRVLELVSKFFDKKVYFDVGANVGHWSMLAAQRCEGNSKVFSLEPSIRTYENLVRNTSTTLPIRCFNVGLSNNSQRMEIYSSKTNPEKSSVESHGVKTLNRKITDYEAETQYFLSGDEFCEKHSIQEITFLKIDTEGHDFKVLQGFRKLLDEGGIHVIQFEYNRLNIYTKTLLSDFYELLNPPSAPPAYCIGRIFPRSVRFKSYDPLDENFIDGNFIAVRQCFGDLVNILKQQATPFSLNR